MNSLLDLIINILFAALAGLATSVYYKSQSQQQTIKKLEKTLSDSQERLKYDSILVTIIIFCFC